MTQITAPIFLEYLQRSRLLDERKFHVAKSKMRAAIGPEKMLQLDEVTRWLVSQNYVTEWQVRQLLKKRYKGFFLRQYKILAHIGTGGMSTVYLAEHSVMQRQVAIKVLPKKKLEKSVYLERFIREAQTIASLDHPNIVRAYDIDQEDDVHYIVMEHFLGRNLQEVVVQDGVMPFEMAADYVRQAALALEYAHQAGVVHRDVKPGNVLVNDQGLVKVLDLGLALFNEHRFDGQLTTLQDDNILGTADFLAPEQAIDSHNVDARADIYGLGGVLYFCLTGHPPFPTGTIPQRLLAHQHEEPQSIFTDRPEAPDSLVQLCQKMMAKKKEHRQQTAIEVVADMQDWLIANGFADEADFPALETLRATNETLGAVPIPSQEQRLKNFNRRELSRQQALTVKPASPELQSDAGDSTVSGMMLPIRRGNPGNTQTGSASSTGTGGTLRKVPQGSDMMIGAGDSASRIHLLTDGQSSSLMPNPVPITNNHRNRLRGVANDDEDDPTLGMIHLPAEEENDPVLFALSEMGLAEPPLRSQVPVTRQQSAPVQAVPTAPSGIEESPRQYASIDPQRDEWYGNVPVWFWCLFGLFVISTIFLAGILVAMVFR